MIFDSISNIEKYKGIYKNLDIVIDFIKNNNLKTLKNGKNIIKDNDIYVNYNTEMKTVNETEGIYEMHKKYLDLHIDINGSEKILFTDYAKEKETCTYSEDDDYVLLVGCKNVECSLDNHHFVICMTNEPHMPCIFKDKHTISKMLFKIKVDE